jgi:hypothetical protein
VYQTAQARRIFAHCGAETDGALGLEEWRRAVALDPRLGGAFSSGDTPSEGAQGGAAPLFSDVAPNGLGFAAAWGE